MAMAIDPKTYSTYGGGKPLQKQPYPAPPQRQMPQRPQKTYTPPQPQARPQMPSVAQGGRQIPGANPPPGAAPLRASQNDKAPLPAGTPQPRQPMAPARAPMISGGGRTYPQGLPQGPGMRPQGIPPVGPRAVNNPGPAGPWMYGGAPQPSGDAATRDPRMLQQQAFLNRMRSQYGDRFVF